MSSERAPAFSLIMAASDAAVRMRRRRGWRQGRGHCQSWRCAPERGAARAAETLRLFRREGGKFGKWHAAEKGLTSRCRHCSVRVRSQQQLVVDCPLRSRVSLRRCGGCARLSASTPPVCSRCLKRGGRSTRAANCKRGLVELPALARSKRTFSWRASRRARCLACRGCCSSRPLTASTRAGERDEGGDFHTHLPTHRCTNEDARFGRNLQVHADVAR
eukprot:6184222-Pleurochrysis_carterae.AAC.2